MNKLKLLAVLPLLLFLVSCAAISDEARYYMDKPIDCSTAEADIKSLEGAKASSVKRVASGVRTIAPAAAVVSIVRKDWGNNKKVATGEYNRAIDEKIMELQHACNIY